MIKVFKLGFADFLTKDVEAMIAYYTEVMGFSLVERGEDGSAYISSSLDHHNIVLTPSTATGLQRIGYQLDNKLSVQEVAKHLKKEGIPFQLKTDAKPGISEFLELKDPDGNIIQLYSAMEFATPGFKDEGIIPNKLGHYAICAKDAKKVVDFYQSVLGFVMTDRIGDNFANFMTCNQDHHVINVVSSKHSRMHHIAFELKDSAHQYRSSDFLSKKGIPVLWGPSRHTAGHNIATYHADPDNHVIELFIDMDIFIPELGYMEPRPWHEELPLRPRVWNDLSAWRTHFGYDLVNLTPIKVPVD